MSESANRVYQGVLSARLRELHGDNVNERTNWVTAISGPQQRPTYTSIFYFDGTEMSRGSGPTIEISRESAAARANARLPRPARSLPVTSSLVASPSQLEESPILDRGCLLGTDNSEEIQNAMQRGSSSTPRGRPGFRWASSTRESRVAARLASAKGEPSADSPHVQATR